jgi:Rrf2 family iron-sulfur cluster assembly transcriptional regulator
MRVTLTLRGDYAVRAMLAIARHERAGSEDGSAQLDPLSAARIATEMRIPQRFVAHVVADLGRAGLVVGSTGRRGGYRLSRPAAAINLLEIVDAAERLDEPPRCVLRGIPCDPGGRCAVHDAFNGATTALRAELARATLAGLADRGA